MLQIWNSVVGDAIAEVTVLQRFSEGKLYVVVKNSSWRMELSFRKQDIIIRLNDALGILMVQDIILR